MEGTHWGVGRLCHRGRSARRLRLCRRRDEGRGLTTAKGAVQSKILRAKGTAHHKTRAGRHRSSHGTPRPSAAYPGNQRPVIQRKEEGGAFRDATTDHDGRLGDLLRPHSGTPPRLIGPGPGTLAAGSLLGSGTQAAATGTARRGPCRHRHAWGVTRL